jgi:glycosidase
MTVLGDAAKARLAASAMLMLPGMPFVYYGEEIGMVGAKPDEMIRTPMQWSSALGGGFTTGKPWEPLQPDWKTKNVAAQDTSGQSLLNHYRKLIQLRNAHPALGSGALTLLQTNDTTGTIAAWLRSSGDEAFLIVVNFGPRHGRFITEPVPSGSLPGGGLSRIESAYADPDHACVGGGLFNNGFGGNGMRLLINSIEAHGFCALQIRRR